MITKLYKERTWTAEEVAHQLDKYRKAGLSAPSLKGKKKVVWYEATQENLTVYLQNLTAEVGKAGKGGEVKVTSVDYKTGEPSTKVLAPAFGAKLLNAALQLGVSSEVMIAFSSAVFDESGLFMHQATDKASDSIDGTELLRRNLNEAIRADEERKAKSSVK